MRARNASARITDTNTFGPMTHSPEQAAWQEARPPRAQSLFAGQQLVRVDTDRYGSTWVEDMDFDPRRGAWCYGPAEFGRLYAHPWGVV